MCGEYILSSGIYCVLGVDLVMRHVVMGVYLVLRRVRGAYLVMRNALHAGVGGWWVVVGISSHEECVTCGGISCHEEHVTIGGYILS